MAYTNGSAFAHRHDGVKCKILQNGKRIATGYGATEEEAHADAVASMAPKPQVAQEEVAQEVKPKLAKKGLATRMGFKKTKKK